MDEATLAELEYLRLRCDILEQVDRDMFGRKMAAGAACARADEAFSGDRHGAWAKCILLGILGKRDRDALSRRGEDREEAKAWMEGEEFAGLPREVKERIERDLRGA